MCNSTDNAVGITVIFHLSVSNESGATEIGSGASAAYNLFRQRGGRDAVYQRPGLLVIPDWRASKSCKEETKNLQRVKQVGKKKSWQPDYNVGNCKAIQFRTETVNYYLSRASLK